MQPFCTAQTPDSNTEPSDCETESLITTLFDWVLNYIILYEKVQEKKLNKIKTYEEMLIIIAI